MNYDSLHHIPNTIDPWKTKTAAAPSGHAAGDGSLQPLGSVHERESGAVLHPNVIEALDQIESVRETVAEMGMWFAARQLASARSTLANHLTRASRSAHAQNAGDQATAPGAERGQNQKGN